MRTLVLIHEAILTSESSRALGGVGAVNTSRYEKDLDNLVNKGEYLHLAMQYECEREEPISEVNKSLGDKGEEFVQALPEFKDDYQPWYSEAKALIRQLLPDRLDDFTRYYEKPKSRKDLTMENYTIEDYLQGLTRKFGKSIVVGPDAAIPRFRQQLSLVKAVSGRFQSSLFEIRQLAQADLFDSELDAAKELAKNKFGRAAGGCGGSSSGAAHQRGLQQPRLDASEEDAANLRPERCSKKRRCYRYFSMALHSALGRFA